MSSQARLPGLLEQGAGKLKIYSGYSYSIDEEIQALSSGIVAGPRWIKNCRREYPALPVILDNGAFPAWFRGESLAFDDQVEAVQRAAEIAQEAGLLESIIAPDIVGGGPASWKRTLRSLPYLDPFGVKLLLPLQEGIDIDEAIAVANDTDSGIFIGGKSMRWKVKAAQLIDQRTYVHVGRVSRDGYLWTFSQLADAVDSTTWTRSQHWNQTINWPQILRRYTQGKK